MFSMEGVTSYLEYVAALSCAEGRTSHCGTHKTKLSFLFSALSVPTTLTGVEAEAAQPAGSARPWAGRGTVRSQPALRPHLLLLLHCQLASKPHPHQAGDPDTTGETADHSATIPLDSGRW